ncbi:MAG: hypothetical protein JRC90_01360 [Deltaproteobacteria bacterium]|nr:hypothetical protein [Deltaproteobacteria bacterium]
MSISYSELENAFLFISGQPPFTNSAILNTENGEIYYQSDLIGIDDLPEDIEIDDEKYIEIPHKNDLNLGRDLVFEFVSQYMKNDLDEIHKIFSRRGAYSRCKDLLEKRSLLQKWYEYENEKTKEALLSWCAENNIEVTG